LHCAASNMNSFFQFADINVEKGCLLKHHMRDP
jgi:hypothetical protein